MKRYITLFFVMLLVLAGVNVALANHGDPNTHVQSALATLQSISTKGRVQAKVDSAEVELQQALTDLQGWGPLPSPSPITPPPPPAARGPSTGIACPPGSVTISVSAADIQTVVDANPAGTSYCLETGIHSQTHSVNPKTGDSFTGEFGAVVDGSGGTFAAPNGGIFNATTGASNVTLRNLVIRGSEFRGVSIAGSSTGWVIDNVEVAFNMYGVNIGSVSVLSDSLIHDNIGDPTNPTAALRGGGYGCYNCNAPVFVNNEIYANGPEQKLCCTSLVNAVFRGNEVHDNWSDGIWFDGAGTGQLVEDNHVYANGRDGITFEITHGGVVRNNVVENNGSRGLFISTSDSLEVYGNTFLNDGIGLRNDLRAGFDLTNNFIHDNTTTVSTCCTAGFTGTAGPEYYTATGSKNNRFVNNTYDVPDPLGRFWQYGGAARTWEDWRSIGHDLTGSVG